MGTAVRSGGQGSGVSGTNGHNGRSDNGGNGGSSGKGGVATLANALALFSLGLGIAQVLAPERVARLAGVPNNARTRTTMRALGLREITSGVGLLSQRQPTAWAWSRVAGDVMDLALLGRVLQENRNGRDRNGRDRTALAAAAVAGVGVLDVLCSQRLAQQEQEGAGGVAPTRGVHVRSSITVNRPVEEVYRFWRDFENLPRFMRHLESVRVTGERRSHWTAKAPAGMSVEWDAELTDDEPNALVAWRSLEDADVPNSGSVRFRPAAGDRGTVVDVELRYQPPAGRVGAAFAKLFREEPGQQVRDDLRAFKSVLETGEVLLSDATARRGPHPGRPLAHDNTTEER